MPGTITDRLLKQQEHIDRRRRSAASGYPRRFAEMIRLWNSPGSDDCLWLMYSANYLFRTAGARWAMDPLTMHRRVPETPELDISHAFDRLDFVLFTHRHADHLDFDLLRALQRLPIRWIIPDFLLPEVLSEAALLVDQITPAYSLQPIDICGIHILPFAGLHWEKASSPGATPHGVPAMGYLLEFNGKRWLFPGDTRSYRSDLLPALGPVDGLFAHLWLGRGCALLDELPLLDDFCRFYLELQPKRVILAHLEEFGRAAEDYWDDRHARQVITRWGQVAPQIPIRTAHMGECINLG
jgi:L-ascorbate metabolism protein UlaG (beta-lactamase superfamily)